ncbi:MAG: Fur family transcriptional regulator [Hyphomicrobiales bacterium]
MAATLTKNQELVLGALTGADAPLSAYAILDKLRDDGLKAPLQVYRALEKLTESGLVHKVESLNSFVACAHPECHSANLIAFAICEKCGDVSEFSDTDIEDKLAHWWKSNRFTPSTMTLELRGACESCA